MTDTSNDSDGGSHGAARGWATSPWLIVWCLTAVVVLAALCLFYVRPWKVNQATAMLEVSPRQVMVGLLDNDLVASHAKTISSENVLKQALASPDVRETRWYRDHPNDAADRLADSLRVKAIPNTNLIAISLEGRRSEELVTIVNAVADSYVAFAIASNHAGDIATLEDEQRHLDKELVTARGEKAEIKQGEGNEAKLVVLSERIATLENQIRRVQARLVEVRVAAAVPLVTVRQRAELSTP